MSAKHNYKPGDIVTFIDNTTGSLGQTVVIARVKGNKIQDTDTMARFPSFNGWIEAKWIRYATEEEKARLHEQSTINNYEIY